MIDLISDAGIVAERIGSAVGRTLASVEEGTVSQEPHITDRLLSRIEDAVNETPNTKARWRARTLTDRGRGAEETEVGADFLGVFEATTTDVSVAKGFLAQAKRLEEGGKLPAAEHNRLRQQCRRMLQRTPDAYVFLYGRSKVRVVSAAAVLGASVSTLDELGVKSPTDFFLDHFRCFIGDSALSSPTVIPPLRILFPDVIRVAGLGFLRIEAVGR